jgi:DivIVA domain-containing protein
MADVDSFLDRMLAALRSGYPPSASDVRAVTFPLTTWRPGYGRRDVDRLVGELAQVVSRPRPDAEARSDSEALPADRALANRIEKSVFGSTRWGGYAQDEVDEFLDRIVHGLLRGERGTLQRLAGEPQFTTVKLRPAYVAADVDALLASVEQALADLGW